jgi:predicted ester cyclase
MTSDLELVREWVRTAEDDMEAGWPYFADDFQWVGTDGTVMDRAAWLGMGSMLSSAMPDLKFVADDIHEEEGSVIMTDHFEGTHENDLDLSAMGMGVFPASGKMIIFPSGIDRVSVEGDKISRMEQLSGSSMQEFLAALST